MAPPPQQPPPDQQLGTDTAEVLATAATVAGATAALAPAFAAQGIARKALARALTVIMAMPPEKTGFYGPATRYAAQLNAVRRAQFVVHSARRMHADALGVQSGGSPLGVLDSMARERRYYGMHLAAMRARELAGARVDSASMLYGRTLGWNTVITPTTTTECLHADGHNFLADVVPKIGYPGMAHPGCRCYPGAPVPGAPMLPSGVFGTLQRIADIGRPRRQTAGAR